MAYKRYIQKSYSVTLKDLNELAEAYGYKPEELKLIINDSNPDFTGYIHMAMLNRDGSDTSIELYTREQ